jgi:aminomuconate-semialdehyde/2-hydroxymuconate-6-semialdehyde dehydrogenase
MEIIKNYINGTLMTSKSGATMDSIEPATGLKYAQLPISEAADIELAVAAAEDAFESWSVLSFEDRALWLMCIADAIEAEQDRWAAAESKDTGKPIALAKSLDIPRAIANFRFFAHAVLHTSSEAHHTSPTILNYTNRNPVGVVGCISPWNLPLYLLSWKIAPALATGNTVVAKPSEITPFTAYMLSQLCIELGFPAGVLNIVHGPGDPSGQAMVDHPGITAISFTGGTETGRLIASKAAPMFKKLSLELGGKNPNIIFQDCDFEAALTNTMRSSFTNQGQICLCGSRVFIQQGIYEPFKQALVEKTRLLEPGDPADPETRLGSIISKQHLGKVLGYLELAKEEGGKVLVGGNPVRLEGRCENGYFMQPAIIEGLDNSCRINQEEIFGPVISLISFKEESEVIRWANEVQYGLSASIWTKDLSRAHRVARSLKNGVVWINCWLVRDLRTPFGGMKQSGVGREGGDEALRFFTEAQNVCIQL